MISAIFICSKIVSGPEQFLSQAQAMCVPGPSYWHWGYDPSTKTSANSAQNTMNDNVIMEALNMADRGIIA